MKQYDAINKILEYVDQEKEVDACFLKGSIADETNDEFSDVDLYFVVNEKKYDKVYQKRLKYLESYQNILYYKDVDFGNKQVVCLYEDGIHIDLYFVKENNINCEGNILVIYDPKKIIKTNISSPLTLQPNEVGNIVDEFSYTMYEFYRAYKRKDYLFSFKLANALENSYLHLLRWYVEPNKSKIPLKGFMKNLPQDDLKIVMEVMKLLKYDTMLLAVKAITMYMYELVYNLPISIAEKINFDLFLFCRKLVNGLDEE